MAPRTILTGAGREWQGSFLPTRPATYQEAFGATCEVQHLEIVCDGMMTSQPTASREPILGHSNFLSNVLILKEGKCIAL